MNTLEDEARTLRGRMAELEKRLANEARPGGQSSATMVLKIDSAPATAKSIYSCKKVDITGVIEEGYAVSFTYGTDAILSANCGTKKPPIGTCVIVDLCSGVLSFQYDGEEE